MPVDTAAAPRRYRELDHISTATWSDALDVLGVEGVLDGIVRRTGRRRAVGTVVTVLEDVAEIGGYSADDLDIPKIIDATGPGDILVVSVGAGARISTFGGIAALRASAHGVEGVIIDGACRDIEEIEETGLCVASRHVSPRSGRGRLRVAGMRVDLAVSGVQVRSGDLCVSDATGTVVIPSQLIDEAASLALELEAIDAGARARVARGEP